MKKKEGGGELKKRFAIKTPTNSKKPKCLPQAQHRHFGCFAKHWAQLLVCRKMEGEISGPRRREGNARNAREKV